MGLSLDTVKSETAWNLVVYTYLWAQKAIAVSSKKRPAAVTFRGLLWPQQQSCLSVYTAPIDKMDTPLASCVPR